MNTKYFSSSLQLKSLNDDGEFSGYGSIFNNKDCQNDIILHGAFKKTLETWKRKDQLPALLWQHLASEPIGAFTAMEEDSKGLRVEGKLLIEHDPVARRAHAHLRNKSVRGLSIGYQPVDAEYDRRLSANIIKEINLFEVSLVTFPANDGAQIDAVKDALSSPRNCERFLRDAGFSRTQAKRILAGGLKGVHCDDETEHEEQLKILIQTLRNT